MASTKLAAIVIFLVIVSICTLGTSNSFAYPPFLKQAKELGYQAKDCTFCHEKSSGGKGWNQRGLWLKDQKKERKAPTVDIRWLKSYNPDESAPEVKKDVPPAPENKESNEHKDGQAGGQQQPEKKEQQPAPASPKDK